MTILHEAGPEPRLEKARHIKYWTRCLKTFLPRQYTGNDSNRMYLAYFIISALDLLDALNTVSTGNERRDHVNWIYRCQHPKGGFRMWPGTDLGDRANDTNAKWDPANIPATYFALAALLILDDDFERVKRGQCLLWLQKMQREDGSFGETLVDGVVEGGRDPRLGYCATGVRHILRGSSAEPISIDGQTVRDIDVDSFVRCVRVAESFDGGIADEPFHEPQAGYTFCSLGALAFVGRLNTPDKSNPIEPNAPCDPHNVLKWLLSRQTELTDPDAGLDTEFHTAEEAPNTQHAEGKHVSKENGARDSKPIRQDPYQSVGSSIFDLLVDGAGMNGRTNKVADTCYAFWVGASLDIVGCVTLCNRAGLRRYLLGKTQHGVLGGFGKFPGDLPDLYHSYLGLAALSLAGSDQVKRLDGGMCLSAEARGRLPGLWDAWAVEGPTTT
ncbi:hypothetical protein LTR36_009616 [Oleoguttula mirabilis]|uniref:Prenyltransferase alpha-alpha toroid domain-containing protein n=1 Tax=Oleoguttula mirabilis TaxID=1507867 RepID=A0AAV9J6N3_9PEZI|nr:hypothetical protein LTR36_009616 [Oleoguttula mirabilis]